MKYTCSKKITEDTNLQQWEGIQSDKSDFFKVRQKIEELCCIEAHCLQLANSTKDGKIKYMVKKITHHIPDD